MIQDAEGEYVANVIDRERNVPRSLPNGNLLKLYTLSPNSRYSASVGFLLVALEGLLLFFRLQRVPYADNPIGLVVGGLLILFAFGFPLVTIRRISNAIRYGVSAIGKVESVRDARTTPYSTAAGMNNGSIEAQVSYTVKDQPYNSKIFLDRPWVGAVKKGTQLRLLIDSAKPSILYVVGIADQDETIQRNRLFRS